MDLKAELQTHIAQAEQEMVATLVKLHHKTGLVPTAFEFEWIDASSVKGKTDIVMGTHALHLNR
ncbi:hypothetical protein G8770_03735 [Aestuariicella hydrocarbonica]|uniref:Uncharacterized protein n=1 Tax=Pseudomaricurvus hydrocarbonicus TaxID=1470433 RepID=A0A9E5MJZ0_9GAMM|nr:hypothetical protein [Aestuariicella hydrocarbonica]NHO64657.1 hypothetical protein [Aestuariicella hydrocarbonica]